MKAKCFSAEVLALYVEGDLRQSKASEIENHVGECAACGSCLAELRESQSMFKSLRQETVSPAALARVRARVLGDVGRGEAGSGWALRLERLALAGFRRRYALAALAIVVILSGVVWRSRSSVQPRDLPAPVAVTLPADVAPPRLPVTTPKVNAPAKPVKHARRQPARKPAPQKPAVEEPHQIVMKILTDDPNIVIYWLLDQKGAGE